MNLHSYPEREEASQAAADLLANSLSSKLQKSDRASMIVSGGTTPVQCFHTLSRVELNWSSVDVALTDERDVSVDHEASNEKMIREILMQDNASTAGFLECSDASLPRITASLACSLVGMGTDGHFASIFPDTTALEVLLDPSEPPGYFKVATAASEFGRITANLSLLLLAPRIVLLMFGDEKRRVLESSEPYPISRLTRQVKVPVEVCWAP